MHKLSKSFISLAFNCRKSKLRYKITRAMTDRNGRDDDITLNPIEGLSWRGCSLQDVYRNLNEFELDHVAAVKVSQDHTILYHCPIRNSAESEPPRPLRASPKWDSLHVRLPCSDKSQYPVTQADGNSTIESRWEMIQKALLRPIRNSHELEKAILVYNSKYENLWKFKALHKLFEDDLDETETQVFFEDLLPRIIGLALQLPELIQAPIPLLKQKQSHSVTLSQQQISCLLANAFLCTFPRRNTLKKKSEYSTFPDINFNRLFQSTGQAVLEKIKCICHYFRRVCPTERDSKNVPSGVVTFTRRSIELNKLPDWNACDAPLGITPLHITSEGTIEDQGLGLLQVDFANKFLGGGVLGHGCVQEEIRFVICPELLVSKLFTECLRPTEALLMIGCERYSNYKGYAGTFQWAGNHEDCIPRDSSRRRMTHIVAIDALAFNTRDAQYSEDLMLRELNKAYVGFLHELKTPAPGVASGNWGCGAFGGEARLKALIQLMACTLTNRPLVYYTFGDSDLRDVVHGMHTFFIEKNVRVCELWQLLKKFKPKGTQSSKDLYEFIYNEIQNPNKNHSWKGCQLTLKKMFSSKKVESSSKQKATNISQDLFASSSDAESEMENKGNSEKSTKTDLSSTTSKIALETRITISDDSETDELLLAAVAEYTNSSKADNVSSTPTDDYSPRKTSPKQTTAPTRQRTLVEMLDQCYTEGSPASKRQCTTKQGPNQNSK